MIPLIVTWLLVFLAGYFVGIVTTIDPDAPQGRLVAAVLVALTGAVVIEVLT